MEEGEIQIAAMEKTEHERNCIRNWTQLGKNLRNSLYLNKVKENSTVLSKREPNSSSTLTRSTSYGTEIKKTQREIYTK